MATPVLTEDDVRAHRMRAQLLAGPPASTVDAAVARLAGVQAQSWDPARLAVRARTSGLTAADVDGDPGLVRTWAMRGTLHLIRAADLRWMVELLGPVFRRADRRRREQLGLDEAACERALPAIERVLTGAGPLTRAALVERLAGEGVRIDPTTQAPAHLMLFAATSGLICRGPGDTYVLCQDRLRTVRSYRPDDPVAELARRYLAGYQPASAADFATWSGLPAATARQGFAAVRDETVGVDAAGEPARMLTLAEPVPPVPRLLGHWDALLLGYQHRRLILDAAHARKVQAGGGFIQPTVIVGGRVAGTWRLERGKRAKLTIEPFGRLPRGSRDGLRAEAEDIGRFLGIDLTL